MKAGLKSSLIMQEESTSARAGAIATDWYLPRPRAVLRRDPGRHRRPDARKAVLDYLDGFPVRDLTLVTLGPDPLTIPE